MQEGWERCREAAESKELRKCSGRFPEMQGKGGQEAGQAAGRSAERLKQCREKGGLWLAEEPGRMQEQERSCKQGCSGSLGPYGCRPGPSIGSPQGRMSPRQLPTGRKVLECRAEPLTYTLWERRGEGQTETEVGDKERQTRSREDRQERAGAGVSKAALANPSIPPNLSQTPTHHLS